MIYPSVRLSVATLSAANLIGHASSVWSATSSSEDTLIDRGRYLAQVAGCNDCHTSGYLMSGGKVSESEWLKGDSFGWRGSWGPPMPRTCLCVEIQADRGSGRDCRKVNRKRRSR
jgi:hypothetical protein